MINVGSDVKITTQSGLVYAGRVLQSDGIIVSIGLYEENVEVTVLCERIVGVQYLAFESMTPDELKVWLMERGAQEYDLQHWIAEFFGKARDEMDEFYESIHGGMA